MTKQEGPMQSDDSGIIDSSTNGEQVWHEGKFDLVPSWVEETYIRHD
jgi:hypothetical protein